MDSQQYHCLLPSHHRFNAVFETLAKDASKISLRGAKKGEVRTPAAISYATDGSPVMVVLFAQPFIPDEVSFYFVLLLFLSHRMNRIWHIFPFFFELIADPCCCCCQHRHTF
jgi:hypothetical protein